MEFASIRTIVAEWAESEPLIRRAWIFGSRVRGTHRSDSDVDLAVEVNTLLGDSCPRTTFAFEKVKLQATIQSKLPLAVQLEWYGGPTETPTIHSALDHSSTLVYNADSNE